MTRDRSAAVDDFVEGRVDTLTGRVRLFHRASWNVLEARMHSFPLARFGSDLMVKDAEPLPVVASMWHSHGSVASRAMD